MSLLATVPLTAAVANLCLGLFVLFHHPRRMVHQMFFALSACLAVWSFSVFMLFRPLAPQLALRWVQLLLTSAVLVPVVFLHLVLLFFDAPRRGSLLAAYAAMAALLVANYMGVLIHGVRLLGPGGGLERWVGNASAEAWFMVCYGILTMGLAMTVLFEVARGRSGIRRTQARYLLLGISLALAGGVHDFSMLLGHDTYPGSALPILPLAPVAILAWASVLSYTILRHRLMNLEVAIARSMTRGAVFVALMVPCYFGLTLAQQAAFANSDLVFSMTALAICALATFAFPRLRSLAERRVESALFSRATAYRKAILEFSREAARILDLGTLIGRANGTLTAALAVRSTAVYVADAEGACHRYGDGRSCSDRFPAAMPAGDTLLSWLAKRREPTVREELELAAQSRGRLDPVALRMREAGIELAVPLMLADKLTGVVLLGARQEGGIFCREDIEVLTILANQLAVAMRNARLCEDLKRSQELVQRSDRLSAIGTMAAGLAHEIRNPLVSIRTFTQLLPERFEDEEFRSSFLDLTLSEVERICGLINELLAFARPAPAELCKVDVNDCLQRLCLLVGSQARNHGVRLDMQLAGSLPLVTADEDQLKQVIMNIVLNAIQSCEGRGVVEISSRTSTEDDRCFVCVEVHDNGRGIESSLLARIFDPFFTTRSEGTGLGLSIAHQIVTRHGGSLDVKSEVGRGSTFLISIPVDPLSIEAGAAVARPETVGLHG